MAMIRVEIEVPTGEYCKDCIYWKRDGMSNRVVLVRSYEFNDITAAIREELKTKKGKKK